MTKERANTLYRTLDTWLGPPLVFCAGLLKGQGRRPENLRSLAALCLGCIGDTVLLSGPLADLARAYPHCRITVFATRSNAEVARLIPAAAEVVPLPLTRPDRAARLLRAAGPFDAVLDFSQWPRISALFSAMTRTGFKAGFRTPGQHRHYAYHAAVAHRADRHEIDNFRALTALLGVQGLSAPHLALPPAIAAEDMPRRPFAVLHPYPGGSQAWMKEWPRENWEDLIQALRDRGLEVVVSGGPADVPRVEALVDACNDPAPCSLAGLPLVRIAWLLQHAAVVVSVNTGIMHLAAALGAPLVALHGPTSIHRWGPLGAPQTTRALRPQLSCSPCLHLGFEYGCADNACMRGISVESVLQAVEELLPRDRKDTP